MGWFDDVINPVGWASSQLTGSNSDLTKFTKNPLANNSAVIPALAGANKKGEDTPSVPGFDFQSGLDAWRQAGQDLNTSKLQADQQGLAGASNAALANSTGNLAMRGGLSSGANERLAADNMNGFQNAYSGLATKYGLGGAEINRQAAEKGLDLQLASQMGAEKAAAIKNASKGGFLSGLLPG